MNNESRLAKDNYLFLWDGMYLFIGTGLETQSHDHYALQIAITTDEPFKMRIKGSDWKSFRSLILASSCSHQCEALQSRIIFISIDPFTYMAKKITEDFLKSSDFSTLPKHFEDDFVAELLNLLTKTIDCRAVLDKILWFITKLTNLKADAFQLILDKRIKQVIQIINNSGSSKIKLEALAKKVYLSESRLVHLFKEQVGIPIRKYVLWRRLNLAAAEIVSKRNLTQAALAAGFSDSAHFSRTFSKVYGISPSSILKNDQNIQAFLCSL